MNSFSCKRALRCLDDLHGGIIEAADREALNVHLAVCDGCRARAEMWQKLEGVMRDTELRPLGATAHQRLLSGRLPPLDAAAGSSRSPRSRRGWILGAAAAVVILSIPLAAVSLARLRAYQQTRTDAPDVSGSGLVPLEVIESPDPPRNETLDAVPSELPSQPDLSTTEPVAAVAVPAVQEPAGYTGVLPLEAVVPPDPETPLALAAGPDIPSIDELSRSAREHRRAWRFAFACRDYRLLSEHYPDSAEATASHVALGQMKLGAMERPDEAVEHFRRYLVHAPDGDLAEDARVGEIRASSALGYTEETATACERYLSLHPDGGARAEVLHYRGDALMELGREFQALEVYGDLLEGWPETTHGAWARARLAEIELNTVPAD